MPRIPKRRKPGSGVTTMPAPEAEASVEVAPEEEAPQTEAAEVTNADAEPRHNVKQTKITCDLRVKLTVDEYYQAGKDLTDAIDNVARAEADLASVKQQMKAEIDGAKAKISRLKGLVQNGSEFRPVECDEIRDFTLGRVFVIRRDTGDTVEDRPMQEYEKQQEIPFEDDEPEPEPEPAEDESTDADTESADNADPEAETEDEAA